MNRKPLMTVCCKFKDLHLYLDKCWRMTLGDLQRIKEYQASKLEGEK